MTTTHARRLKLRMKWTHRLCARYLGVDCHQWLGWHSGKHTPKGANAEKVVAALERAMTKDGKAEMKAWAKEYLEECEARKSGR